MGIFRVVGIFAFASVISFGQNAKYGHVPLAFEENRGQFDSRASFFLRGGDLSLFVTKSGPVLTMKNGG